MKSDHTPDESFTIERVYQAPRELVWKAISNKDDMKQWYFDLSAFKPEPGFEFEFTGRGSKGEEYIHHCRILEVIPEQKLSYTWAYKNYAGSSTVTFELFEESRNVTRLRLTHAGLGTFPANNPDFAKESFAGGWTELIGSLLKTFVEKQG